MAPTLRLVAIACAFSLPAVAALRLPAAMSRRAVLGGAAAAVTLAGAPAAHAAAYMNAAEVRLQDMVVIKVAEQEKSLGFKFEPEDVAEVETILRNKYCGKSGLFGAMEGGMCEENVLRAAYCPTFGSGASKFSSGAAGCAPPPKPKPVDTGPPKAPTMPSMPSLPSLPF